MRPFILPIRKRTNSSPRIVISPYGPLFDYRGCVDGDGEETNRMTIVNIARGRQHVFDVKHNFPCRNTLYVSYPSKSASKKRQSRKNRNVVFTINSTDGKFHANIQNLYFPKGRLRNDPTAYAVVSAIQSMANTATVIDASRAKSGMFLMLPHRDIYPEFKPKRKSLSPKERTWKRKRMKRSATQFPHAGSASVSSPHAGSASVSSK